MDCFNRKQLIDERDDELNEMPELKTEKIKLKKSKDKNDDYNDTIPMYVRQEINNDAYKTAMDIDIKTFNTFNERKNTTKTKWKAINEVIEETYFIESNIFPIASVNKCKDNENEAITIQCEIKYNKKRMEIEQGLYAQVVIVRRQDLKIQEDKKINNLK